MMYRTLQLLDGSILLSNSIPGGEDLLAEDRDIFIEIFGGSTEKACELGLFLGVIQALQEGKLESSILLFWVTLAH